MFSPCWNQTNAMTPVEAFSTNDANFNHLRFRVPAWMISSSQAPVVLVARSSKISHRRLVIHEVRSCRAMRLLWSLSALQSFVRLRISRNCVNKGFSSIPHFHTILVLKRSETLHSYTQPPRQWKVLLLKEEHFHQLCVLLQLWFNATLHTVSPWRRRKLGRVRSLAD
jgi:hypothetical protein